MANIKTHLNNIKGALYGKDVRGSIHDGMDAINKEIESTTGRQVDLENTFDQLVINAGNSNAEIVDARVKSDGTSYSKLGDRLNEVDSQLAHNTNKLNFKINVEDFGAVGDGVTDDTEAIKKAIEYCSLNKIQELHFTKTYLVNSPIELVNYREDMPNKPLSLISSHNAEYLSCIIANTGDQLFRFIGCHNIKLKLNIISTLSRKYNSISCDKIEEAKRKGCLIAYNVTRSADAVSTHSFIFSGRVYLENAPEYNNGYGSIVIYNDTCEMSSYTDLWYLADTPVFITKQDHLKKNENPYTLSCKDHDFYGKIVLCTYANKSCLACDGVDNLRYFGYGNSGYGQNITDNESAFIDIISSIQNFYIQVDCEGLCCFSKGKAMSYGDINISGVGYIKGFTNKNCRNITIKENIYYKSNIDNIIIDMPTDGYYANITYYSPYITEPRIINVNNIFVNNILYVGSDGGGSDLISINKGSSVVKSTYDIISYKGNVNQNKCSLNWSYGKPTIENNGDGSIYINRSPAINSTNNGEGAIFVKNGDKFSIIGQHSYRTISDISTAKPQFLGEFVIDTNKKLHMAYGLNVGEFTN